MLKETSGNLFKAKPEALINAVNCVGVMGKGIALQFRQKFPADYLMTKGLIKSSQYGNFLIGLRCDDK
jgi:O-acetyl-ADP-ribose deacetylase (regulator of RNase III)